MNNQACHSIRQSLVDYLAEQTFVHHYDDECVVTVPMSTFDNRWVDVTVEDRLSGYYVVHDGGKAADELFLQGLSEKREKTFQTIAECYGVSLDKGRFVAGCKAEDLQRVIWRIAHCSGLAMGEMLKHRASAPAANGLAEIQNIILNWGEKSNTRVQTDVTVSGKTAEHRFDLVANRGDISVSINVLRPLPSSLARAERYGFQRFDTKETYRTYGALAVLDDPSEWTSPSRRIIQAVASRTVEFKTVIDSAESITDSLEVLLAEAA